MYQAPFSILSRTLSATIFATALGCGAFDGVDPCEIDVIGCEDTWDDPPIADAVCRVSGNIVLTLHHPDGGGPLGAEPELQRYYFREDVFTAFALRVESLDPASPAFAFRVTVGSEDVALGGRNGVILEPYIIDRSSAAVTAFVDPIVVHNMEVWTDITVVVEDGCGRQGSVSVEWIRIPL